MGILTYVAGGSGCAREAREEIQLDSSPIFSRPARLFCTHVRDRSSRGYPLPPATHDMGILKQVDFLIGNAFVV